MAKSTHLCYPPTLKPVSLNTVTKIDNAKFLLNFETISYLIIFFLKGIQSNLHIISEFNDLNMSNPKNLK